MKNRDIIIIVLAGLMIASSIVDGVFAADDLQANVTAYEAVRSRKQELSGARDCNRKAARALHIARMSLARALVDSMRARAEHKGLRELQARTRADWIHAHMNVFRATEALRAARSELGALRRQRGLARGHMARVTDSGEELQMRLSNARSEALMLTSRQIDYKGVWEAAEASVAASLNAEECTRQALNRAGADLRGAHRTMRAAGSDDAQLRAAKKLVASALRRSLDTQASVRAAGEQVKAAAKAAERAKADLAIANRRIIDAEHSVSRLEYMENAMAVEAEEAGTRSAMAQSSLEKSKTQAMGAKLHLADARSEEGRTARDLAAADERLRQGDAMLHTVIRNEQMAMNTLGKREEEAVAAARALKDAASALRRDMERWNAMSERVVVQGPSEQALRQSMAELERILGTQNLNALKQHARNIIERMSQIGKFSARGGVSERAPEK